MQNNQNKYFWNNVKIELTQQGISYERLATAISAQYRNDGFKIGRSSISNYINGKSYPNDDRIYAKVASFLGIEIKELLIENNMKDKYNIIDEQVLLLDMVADNPSWTKSLIMVILFACVVVGIAEFRKVSAVPVISSFYIECLILYLLCDISNETQIPVDVHRKKIMAFMKKNKIYFEVIFIIAVAALPKFLLENHYEIFWLCIAIEISGINEILEDYRKNTDDKKIKRWARGAEVIMRILEGLLGISVILQIYGYTHNLL